MTDTEQLELATALTWAVTLPVTLAWTLWAMHRYPRRRWALAGSLVVALPGMVLGVEFAAYEGLPWLQGRAVHLIPGDFVGPLLSFLWLPVGPVLLTTLALSPAATRVPRLLVVAHIVLWALSTWVGLRIAVSV